MSDGTSVLSLCVMNLTKTQKFNEMLDKPTHERSHLWDCLIKSIPESSLEHTATQERASVPEKIRKMEEDVFGCPSKTYILCDDEAAAAATVTSAAASAAAAEAAAASAAATISADVATVASKAESQGRGRPHPRRQ